jgi:hypothetical protein
VAAGQALGTGQSVAQLPHAQRRLGYTRTRDDFPDTESLDSCLPDIWYRFSYISVRVSKDVDHRHERLFR